MSLANVIVAQKYWNRPGDGLVQGRRSSRYGYRSGFVQNWESTPGRRQTQFSSLAQSTFDWLKFDWKYENVAANFKDTVVHDRTFLENTVVDDRIFKICYLK